MTTRLNFTITPSTNQLNFSPSQNQVSRRPRASNSTGEDVVDRLRMFQRMAEQTIRSFLPSSILGLVSCKQEHVYQATKTGLIGASVIGVGGTAVACIAGGPGAVVLPGLLTVTTVAGAIMADRAAHHCAESRQLGDLRGQTAEMARRNQELARQTTILTDQNANLTANVNRFTRENAILTANVARLNNQVTALQGNITQFALQNESYRSIAEQFGTHVEQFRTGNLHNLEEFSQRLEEMTQQIAASRALWDRVSRDHSTQLTQLRDFVAQLSNPRNTLIRLEEHQEINRQIQAATTRLTELGVQIALRDGQLRERDQLLVELRAAHRGILAAYEQQNQILGERNEALEVQINRCSELLSNYVCIAPEITVYCDVGFGNTLGIRTESNWEVNIPWRYEDGRWKGAIPLDKSFKFVFIPADGPVRWEGGYDRVLRDRNQVQREVDGRRIVFNEALETRINRFNTRAAPETTVDYDVGFSNTLGIRTESNWEVNIPWRYEDGRWKGSIPLGKFFKFVFISTDGPIRWEDGPDRVLHDRNQVQREIDDREIQF